jgi:RIO-like serine/threonine protein kinase
MREDEFPAIRGRLVGLLSKSLSDPIYSANRRSIYLAEDPILGRVAIKEMRYESAMRRLWFRTVRSRHALREFRVGSGFAARGGRTPAFLGAALDRDLLALRRVIVFIRWLDGVETLTDYLGRQREEPPDEMFDRIGASLVAAARLGLIHGRHSSDNILVDSGGEEPVFYAIDFAYSRLNSGFDEAGFVRDVARIAHWLWHEKVCSDAALERFFERVAQSAWPDQPTSRSRSKQMLVELERWKQLLAKGPVAQARRERTT